MKSLSFPVKPTQAFGGRVQPPPHACFTKKGSHFERVLSKVQNKNNTSQFPLNLFEYMNRLFSHYLSQDRKSVCAVLWKADREFHSRLRDAYSREGNTRLVIRVILEPGNN